MRAQERKTLRRLCLAVCRLNEKRKEELLAQGSALLRKENKTEKITRKGFSEESPAK